MIRRAHFKRVHDAVLASGVGDEIDALVNPKGTGRPRGLPTDVFLTALIMCVGHRRSLSLVNVHTLLTIDLARSYQTQLGVRHRDTRATLTLRQVRYLFSAIAARLTPEKRDDDADTPEDVALDRLANRIIGISIPAHLHAPTDYAMDATAIHSFARGIRQRLTRQEDPAVARGTSTDPDARWGHCTKTQDNRSSRVFGYAAFTVVGVPPVGAPRDSMPVLTYKLLLRPANSDVAGPGLALLDELDAAGTPADTVIADRAWSYLTADRWAIPLRERGIKQVLDLHPADRGPRDHNGILMISGRPHCPATPEHLRNITPPGRFTLGPPPRGHDRAATAEYERQRAELETFLTAIVDLQLYSFQRKSRCGTKGQERWECPAQVGKVTCERCPISQLLPADTPVVAEPPAADTAPVCCKQRTVTIPGHVAAKLRQELVWGSPEWIRSYSRRTYVESSYGNLKSAKGENIRRGWCFVWGRAKTTLLLAVALTASNIRVLRAWARRTGDITDPLCEPDPDDHGFEELDAEGNPDLAAGPPGTLAA